MTKIKINILFGVILVIVCEVDVSFARTGFSTTKISPQPLWNATYTDKLRHDLLLNYDKFARPAQPDQKITVKLGLTLRHFDLNEMKSTLTVHCWMKLSWKDQKLQWNATDYGGITILHLAEHEIWQPDIFVYNSATSIPISYYSNTHFLVQTTGDVIWVPSAHFTVLCNLDLKYWPFDSQTCEMRFGSWTYHGDLIDIDNYNTSVNEVEVNLLVNNTEWTILETQQIKKVVFYSCCTEPYPSIDIIFSLKRISPSYKAIIVTPAFVVMILTLLNFWLPPQSGEKIVINGCTTIIICLFLLYFTQKLPAMGTHTPLIVLFYTSCLYLVSLSMIGSVVVITISRTRHSNSLPWIIKQHLTGRVGQTLGLNAYIRQSSLSSHRVTAEEMRDHQVTDFDDTTSDEHHIVRPPSGSGIKPSLQQDWVLLAAAVDRILFVVYFFIFAILAIVYSL